MYNRMDTSAFLSCYPVDTPMDTVFIEGVISESRYMTQILCVVYFI